MGVNDPASLRLIDQPPAASLAEARNLLRLLGAVDAGGGLTAVGRKIRMLALPPRLAAMVIHAAGEGKAAEAALLAVLLTEQGLGGPSLDLEERLRWFKAERGERAEAARRLAVRIAEASGAKATTVPSHPGALLMRAFPDRIALQRGGGDATSWPMAAARSFPKPTHFRQTRCS